MDPCTIPELDFNATNLAEAWRKWKSAMQLYLDTLPPSVKERQKTAKMLLQIGEKGRDVYSTWKIESAELTVALLMKKFGEYCEPKKNLIIERHKFLHHDQVEGESIDSYVTTLKKLASYCEFQQLEEGLVLTKLIGGIRSDGLRRNLLKDSADLTLEKALNMCKADEMTAKHLALFDQKKQTETQEEAEVDAVSRNWSKSTSKQRLEKRNTRERDGYDGTRDQCQRCGYVHRSPRCPAMGKTCQKCGRQNHFAKMCHTGRRIQVLSYQDYDEDDVGEQEHHVGLLDACHQDAWYTSVKVNGTPTRFKLDTGAEVNLIPRHILGKINVASIRPTKTRLTAFGGNVLFPMGKITAQCVTKEKTVDLEFYVVDFASTPILGLPGCTKLKLIDRIEEVRQMKESEERGQLQHEDTVTTENAGLGKSGVDKKARLKTKRNKPNRKEKQKQAQDRRNERTWEHILEGRDPVDGSKFSERCRDRTAKDDMKNNVKKGKKDHDPMDGVRLHREAAARQDQKKTEESCKNESDFRKLNVDVFKGIGCFKEQCHIDIKEGAKPVVHAPRKVPYSIRTRLKNKLEEMERDHIIQKVNYPTDWVSSLVIVEKPDSSLRLCLDPKDLNNVIRRER